LGNLFLITLLLGLLFLFFFLDHHTGHPARHDAWILLMSASSMPFEFFHRRFDLLEAYFL
jgi:Ca2+/Na+ antiporter